MKDILSFGWETSYMACLVDDTGRFLAHTDPHMKGMASLGDTMDPLELEALVAIKEQPYGTLKSSGRPPERVAGFYHLHNAPWVIILYARRDQILAPILRFRFYYALAGFTCLTIILALIHLGARPVVNSIKQISQAAGRVAQGDYGEPLPVHCPDEIGQLTQSFNEMVAGLKERDYISNTFGRYVDPKIARELLNRPEAALIGGEKRQVAILFADLRAFTPIAENLIPEETIRLINRFFSEMIEVIHRHHGIIVDFFGDGLLAFSIRWTAPWHRWPARPRPAPWKCRRPWGVSTRLANISACPACNWPSASTRVKWWWATSAPKPGPNMVSWERR